MITKLIQTGAYDFGEQPSRLVDPPSRMQRHLGLAKAAGVNDIFGDAEIDVPDNHTVVHVIAVGDSDRYGANRNGDEFSRDDNIRKHSSFRDNGHVFRNHKNYDPIHKIGEVLASAHNDPASRIELLLALDNQKCEDELQKVAGGGDLPTSMGSKQAYDVCSFCGHQAKTAAEHCSHVKNHLGEVAENGVKVAMLNPDPNYFDISLVFKPADRVAYTLRNLGEKIASASGTVGGHQLAEAFGLCSYDSEKRASITRLASIMKEQPAVVKALPCPLPPPALDELKGVKRRGGDQHLLGKLHDQGLLLSPGDFGQIFLGEDGEKMEAACDEFGPEIDELIADGDGPDSLDGECEIGGPDIPDEILPMVEDALSMDSQPVKARVIRLSVTPRAKVASNRWVDTHELRGLADLYAFYKLAFAHRNQHRPDRLRNLATTF